MKKEKSKKKKIRFKGLIVIILIIYLLFVSGYYLFSMPIKHIEINGNVYLKDSYIIDYLGIENNSFFKIRKKTIEEKILKLDLISDVTVKKGLFGKVVINVKEDKILFYDWNVKKMILSSKKEVEYNKNYLGVPVLINYVPEEIYNEFILKLTPIETDIISLVSEIEYSPSIVNDKVVDDKRFLFRMNDGNKVFVNTINMDKFANYLEIYDVIVNKNGNVTGCLYLDSNSENNYFNKCEIETVVSEEDVTEVGEN